MPLSMTPTTTSSPVKPASHGPFGADRPRNFGELSVCSSWNVFGTTVATPGWRRRASAWVAVIAASKPLMAYV